MRALKIGCSPMRGRTQPMGFDCKHGYAQEEYRPIADTIKRTEIGLLTGAAEGREQGGTPPPRNWVHKKISGCAFELNTQNCAWFSSQISLITAMSFREAVPPPNHPPGALPLGPGPRWGTSVSQTPCAPHLQFLATPPGLLLLPHALCLIACL